MQIPLISFYYKKIKNKISIKFKVNKIINIVKNKKVIKQCKNA